MRLSKIMSGMSVNILAQLEDRKREIAVNGGQVINLSAGTPDLPPDKHVMEALAAAAMDAESYKYAIKDSAALLDAACGWYRRRFGVELDPDQVTSLYGSQEGMAHVTFPFCDPGDIVLAPDPCYPIFSFGPFMRGCQVHRLPLRWEQGFLIDLDAIDPALADRAKVMIVSYPNNPTTATAPPEFYERLIHFAKRHDIMVLHDNAYSELVLDGKPGPSFLQFPGAEEVGIEFNSLSKSYNLTGMRVSFALGNREMIAALKKLRSQIDYGPFPAIQAAAIAALEGPQDILDQNRREYRLRRDALCGGLRAAGWDVPDCDGTMFTWFPLPNGRTDDTAFVFEMLEKTGVIAVPGSSFGKMGEGFIRFALVQPVEILERAVKKIAGSGLLNG